MLIGREDNVLLCCCGWQEGALLHACVCSACWAAAVQVASPLSMLWSPSDCIPALQLTPTSVCCFWLAAGAISTQGEGISVYGLNSSSAQGDKEIVSLLQQFGARVYSSLEHSFVAREKLEGITIDASNIPDLVPILAVVAAVSKGTTRIIKADRVRIKESDRLHAISECLNSVGANVTELSDGLIIQGVDRFTGGKVSSFNDHRIVMAMSIASCCSCEEIYIDGAEAINKSYPSFFDDFNIVGGRVAYI